MTSASPPYSSASSIAVFVLLRGIAAGLMALARRLPRTRITMLRLAIANIYRPGALTPSVVLSLGLGLAVLVTITQIDGNLRRQFLAALPERAPSFYFIDIPSAEAERFGAFLKQVAPQLDGGGSADAARAHRRGARRQGRGPEALARREWVLQSDRGLTYTGEIPKGSKIVEGEWWSADYRGPAAGLDGEEDRRRARAKIGDEIVVNVLGRDITAKIANLRNSRLAGARHQLRAGVLAQRLQGRPAHPCRHPDRNPSGCRPATPRSSSRSPTPFRW